MVLGVAIYNPGIIFSTIAGDLIPLDDDDGDDGDLGLKFVFLPKGTRPPAVFIEFILGFRPLNLYLNFSY